MRQWNEMNEKQQKINQNKIDHHHNEWTETPFSFEIKLNYSLVTSAKNIQA